MTPLREHVKFNSREGHPLAGILDLGSGNPKTFAIWATCFTCTKDLKSTKWISEFLAEHGIGVLRFDFTGLGNSGGDFSETNFSSYVEDVLQAAAFLKNHYQAPQLLIGHSLGGSVVLRAAPRIPEVKAVVTIAAPLSIKELGELLVEKAPEITSQGEGTVNLGTGNLTIKKQMIDDFSRQDLKANLKVLDKPLLILHSPIDEQVKFDNAQKIYDLTGGPKELCPLPQSGHLLLDPDEARQAGEKILNWSKPFLT